jgi:hypothetical protein
VLTIILTSLQTQPLKSETDIFGYFENRFFLVNNTDTGWNNLKEKFKLGDYNRLRLKLKASPSKKVTVNIALDFFSFHGIVNSPIGTYEQTGNTGENQGSDDVTIDLDRAYVNLYFKKFDVTVGKQRVALGVSYLWAPLDLFNRINVFEPKEEKPGANAVKVYVPLGSASSLTGVFAPENDFSASRSAFRAKTRLGNVDVGATAIRAGDTGTTVFGLDLRGENFAGWWMEAGWFDAPERNDLKLVLGFDYTFPFKNGIYWMNEFYYDQSGEKDYANYDYSLLLSGRRFTLGQKYLFSMLRYGFNDFISASVSFIGNLEDGSYIIYPAVGYDIMQNVSISGGFYFPLGKTGGEFNTSNRTMFFLWLKVNF